MTFRKPQYDTRRAFVLAWSTTLLVLLAGCGTSAEDPQDEVAPAAARTFTVSLTSVEVVDRTDNAKIEVSEDSVSGTTATLP